MAGCLPYTITNCRPYRKLWLRFLVRMLLEFCNIFSYSRSSCSGPLLPLWVPVYAWKGMEREAVNWAIEQTLVFLCERFVSFKPLILMMVETLTNMVLINIQELATGVKGTF